MSALVSVRGAGFRVMVAIVLTALSAAYGPVILHMMRVWWNDSYAGHGMFVPLFSAHFLWSDRRRIRASAGGRDGRGLLVVIAGVAVLFLGHVESSLVLQGISLVIALSGIVYWIWGTRVLRAAAFPLGFLVLMVPLPAVLVAAVTLDLQRFAARFAGGALSLLDVPFAQHGVTIELPTLTLQVAEVCNGLRFLAALLVLTLAFAHVTQRTVTRKIVLTLSAIPVAIVANAVRVTGVVLAVQYIGPHAASGIIHNSIGKGVWALTIAGLWGLNVLLRRSGAPVGLTTAVVSRADGTVPGQ
jgi:exosortase